MSLSIPISHKDVVKAINRRHRAFRSELDKGMMRAAQRAKTYMRKQGPVDQGQLKNSWNVERVAPLKLNLVNTAPYAGVIEEGARPHAVSRAGWQAIYDWVYRNRAKFSPQGPRQRAAGPRQRFKAHPTVGPEATEESLKAITWGIVNKIKRYGQKGTFFVKNSMPQINAYIREQSDLAAKRTAARKVGPEGGGK